MRCVLVLHVPNVSCSASSQVFFLLKESELTPSGANLLDGRYAVFGYAVQGQDSLGLMKVRCLPAGRVQEPTAGLVFCDMQHLFLG
jgi:cyclophilin family peptidyl-prolyl cis-trans isomerase